MRAVVLASSLALVACRTQLLKEGRDAPGPAVMSDGGVATDGPTEPPYACAWEKFARGHDMECGVFIFVYADPAIEGQLRDQGFDTRTCSLASDREGTLLCTYSPEGCDSERNSIGEQSWRFMCALSLLSGVWYFEPWIP